MLESLVRWSATIAVFGTLCPLLMIEFGTLPAVDPTLYAHTDEALEERCMAEVKPVSWENGDPPKWGPGVPIFPGVWGPGPHFPGKMGTPGPHFPRSMGTPSVKMGTPSMTDG